MKRSDRQRIRAEFASQGGKARARKLSKAERKASARKAALVRWKNHVKKTGATSQKSTICSAVSKKEKE